MARENPGFGGLYLDESGVVQIMTTDIGASKYSAISASITKVLGDVGLANTASEFREVRYDFIELFNKKSLVFDHVASLDGWSRLDIDERNNLIRLSVTGPEYIAGAKAMMRRVGVPEDMSLVDVIPYAQPLYNATGQSGMSESLSPSSKFSHAAIDENDLKPLVGGFKIDVVDKGQAGYRCTMSFSGKINPSTYGLVTNSHCSEDVWVVGNDNLEQGDAGDFIGTEEVDFVGWGPGVPKSGRVQPCPQDEEAAYDECRSSDSAFYEYVSTYEIDEDFKFGFLAQTEERVSSGYGSKDIEESPHEVFEMTSEATSHVGGTTLEKIGQKTGWSYGTIGSTCLDMPVPDHETTKGYLCQYQVTNTSAFGGDSGAPVFKWPNQSVDEVVIYGILHSSDGDETGSPKYFPGYIYSPISTVMQEAGVNTVF